MNATLKKYSILMLSALPLTACSVAMSLQGDKDPNMNNVKQGAKRTDIDIQLGAPSSTERLPNGQTRAIYDYEVGQEASTGRAVVHGVMDVLTLGIWEVVGTPIEALKGDKMRLQVIYDAQDNVISAQHLKAPSSSASDKDAAAGSPRDLKMH